MRMGMVTSDILDREPRQDAGELSPSWDTEAANTKVINNTGHSLNISIIKGFTSTHVSVCKY